MVIYNYFTSLFKKDFHPQLTFTIYQHTHIELCQEAEQSGRSFESDVWEGLG